MDGQAESRRLIRHRTTNIGRKMPMRHRTFTVALSLFAMMAAPTLAAGEVPDGDPCEVLVANTRAIVPGAVLRARPVGVLLMQDEHGTDEKIVAVPAARLTRCYDAVRDHTDLPEITRQQIQHFFEHYKDLEPGKWARILGWDGPAAARRMIREAIESASNPASAGSA